MPEFIDDESEDNCRDQKREVLAPLGRHSPQKLTVTFAKVQGGRSPQLLPFAEAACVPSRRAAKMHRDGVELFDPILRFMTEAER